MEPQIKIEYFDVPVFEEYEDILSDATIKRSTSTTPIEDDDIETKRCTRPSDTQMDMLLTSIEDNKAFARGRRSRGGCKESQNHNKNIWQNITARLNRVNGDDRCYKTPTQWRKFWCDKKAQIQKKLLLQEKLETRVGGALRDAVVFSDVEQRILRIMERKKEEPKFQRVKMKSTPDQRSRSSEYVERRDMIENEEIVQSYNDNIDAAIIERLKKLEAKRSEIERIDAQTHTKMTKTIEEMSGVWLEQNETIKKAIESTNLMLQSIGGIPTFQTL